MGEPLAISRAQGSADMAHIRALFTEYQEWLGIDLCFQDFDEELRDLPGKYAAPGGELLLGRGAADVVGGVGLRPLGDGICEMKRLYVRPAWRGRGWGRRLAAAIVDAARTRDYTAMRLDTFIHLGEAMALYRSIGFAEIAPYCENPENDVVCMALELAESD